MPTLTALKSGAGFSAGFAYASFDSVGQDLLLVTVDNGAFDLGFSFGFDVIPVRLSGLAAGSETLAALGEILYAWQYLFPGTIYPAQSLTGGNIYPGLYGDRTGLTLTVGVEGTETLTPLTEA